MREWGLCGTALWPLSSSSSTRLCSSCFMRPWRGRRAGEGRRWEDTRKDLVSQLCFFFYSSRILFHASWAEISYKYKHTNEISPPGGRSQHQRADEELGAEPLFLHVESRSVEMSLSPTTDILIRDLCHWGDCQGHCYHGNISSSNNSSHPEGKHYLMSQFKSSLLYSHCI